MGMNAKDIIIKLKETFAALTTEETTQEPIKQPFMDATLKDGTAIQITEMAVGGIVTINGNPAPTGEHELMDGTKIYVGENGAITQIEVAEQVPQEDEMANKFNEFLNTANEKFATLENKFTQYETKFADYENRLNKAYQVIEGLKNLTQTLAETPTGQPDESIKQTNSFGQVEKKPFNYEILFSKK